MAFESDLPAAYQDEGPVVSFLQEDQMAQFDYAEPSPIMLFAARWWRRFTNVLKIGVMIVLIAGYPVATILSNNIDDSDIALNAEQAWMLPQAGVAIHKIARELEGSGWAGDRANWHPQARLTAMPAWQEASAEALADHTRLMAVLSSVEGEPDEDLTAASRLLHTIGGEDMRPRLTAAAQALNRYDGRVARGLANMPTPREALISEARLFAGWAEAGRRDLATQIHREKVEFPAGRADIKAYYAVKARAHIASQMLTASVSANSELMRNPNIRDTVNAASDVWKMASHQKPLIVSNQSGEGLFLPNHLAGMAFHMVSAQEASLALAKAIEDNPAPVLDTVASNDTPTP